MKAIIKESLKQLVADRFLLMLLSAMSLLALTVAIIVGLKIKPSEMQLVSHYSAFGITHLYRDQWFYLLVFVLFPIITAALHGIISVKLLVVKGRSLAIMFAWLGISVILLGFATAWAVINVWTPL